LANVRLRELTHPLRRFWLTVGKLTGETEAQSKAPASQRKNTGGNIFDLEHVDFMGTHVTSGSGLAVALRTGDGKVESPDDRT
jgi:hypothetical protein